ncbi:FkbM family methyltransferase [Viscerimonas tarda]
MISSLKRFIFRFVKLETYLKLMQSGYFAAYNWGILKSNETYKYHYFVRNLIKKGDTVIDIGANLGYYTFLFSKWVGDAGRVYAVEPIEIFNKVLQRKAGKQKNVTFFPYALGLEEKEVLMVTSSGAGYLRTGLPHVFDPKRDSSPQAQDFSFTVEMKVPSVLFRDIDRIDYIKCDIEGFEYTALTEMEDILKRHKPTVQVEVWADTEQQLLDYFDSLGYTPYKLLKKKLVSDKDLIKQAGGDYIFIPNSDKR